MSKVAVLECGNYNPEMLIAKLNQGLDLLGGWDKYVAPGMKVLLKVNLIGPKGSETGAVTHCEFVRAIIRILKEKGCVVRIGDSSGGAIAGMAPTALSFEVSGLKKAALEEGAEIINFDGAGVIKVEPKNGFSERMYLAKPVFEADLVINLPKLKTHSAAIYTGAVKNVFGLIPGLRKAEYHKLAPDPAQFGQILADIHQAVPALKLHIMDGVTAMQGEGPTAGTVYHSNKLLISSDPLALDIAAIHMIGADPNNVPILHAARANNLGEFDLAKIEIVGDYPVLPRLQGFKLPARYQKKPSKNRSKMLVHVVNFFKKRPKINQNLCQSCGMCIESCPVEAIDKHSKKIDYAQCIECLCCHELCRYQAVELKNDNRLAALFLKLYKRK